MGRVGHPAHRWLIAFAGIAFIAGVLLVSLGSVGRFYGDEWMYLGSRSLDPATWWAAHNEHWVTLHVIAYSALVAVFGTGSYLPFLVALAAVHVATAAGVWRLVAAVGGEGIGLAAAAVFLFLGAGYQNLLWAFQIGMIGGLGLGVWSIVLLRTRPRLAAILMTAAVATSGNGLFVACGGISLAWLVRRSAVPIMLAPFVVFAGWFALIGRSTTNPRGAPLSLDVVLGIPAYLLEGIAAAAGGVLAIGTVLGGLALLGAIDVGLLLLVRGRSVSALIPTAIVVLVAQYVALALSRTGYAAPDESRFIYLAAPWILVVLGWAASAVPDGFRWRATLAAATTVLVIANGIALVHWAERWPSYISDDPRMVEYFARLGAP